MMSLYTLKPRFQALLRPSVRTLHGFGVTANQVTVAACAASVGLGVTLAAAAQSGHLSWFLLLPIGLLLRMALNAIDGMLAREFAQSSTLGAYLNELCDMVSDAALYLPFALLPDQSPALTILVILLANLAEMAGVLRIPPTSTRRNDGPMGKSDRALVFGVLGLLVGMGVAAAPWLSWVLAIVALLLVSTVANRVRRGIADDGDRLRP
ncbi:MAG: CDP-alcohol phosphatidyltransferase family protein [Candidatus Accumulibacter phosphatis]|uniref:CDP-alcohol phosphatidyltransferase family protein n=1 Tax=Candidatus Accumulibacter phosphatis TaxID=327160 RepID=UPI001A545561|nr:CDP-alcohol phosphatidyltransferase family protein [Candidatus Accumulibacter phosphatis]